MRYFVKLTFLFGLTACQPFSSSELLSNTGGRLSNLQIGQAGSSIDLGFSGPSGVVLTELPDSAIDGAVPVTVSPIKKDISLSNEQDFDAVASEQSIESDAARIAANREKYIVVEVKDLPTREGTTPNVVDYAIQTDNPVGVQLYRRFVLSTENRYRKNCQKFSTSEMAQQAFLAGGGPVRDRLGIDPDGDGFACDWDPRSFRAVVQN